MILIKWSLNYKNVQNNIWIDIVNIILFLNKYIKRWNYIYKYLFKYYFKYFHNLKIILLTLNNFKIIYTRER